MSKLLRKCPVCESEMFVREIACDSCKTTMRGDFSVPELMFLPDEDLEFIMQFVLLSGSLKDMAKEMSISYPTIRNRLDGIISKIKDFNENKKTRKSGILKRLENNEISVEEAEEMLRRL